MKSSELRAQARESLQGKWGKGAVLTLVYMIATIVISVVLSLVPVVGQIASFLISPVISFGIVVSFIKLSRNEDPTVLGFLSDGFQLFGKVWGVVLHTLLKLLLPLIVLFIAGVFSGVASAGDSAFLSLLAIVAFIAATVWYIMKVYSLSLTSFILYDEPNLSSAEIVNKSISLMEGNRWRYFCLSFSFIGWSILAVFTLGIGYFWVMPYMQIACVKFYEELAGSGNSVTTNTEDNLAE